MFANPFATSTFVTLMFKIGTCTWYVAMVIYAHSNMQHGQLQLNVQQRIAQINNVIFV